MGLYLGDSELDDRLVRLIELERVATGAASNLEQKLLAQRGQPGLTILGVGYTDTNRIQGVSLADGNVVEVYASGDDFSNHNDPIYREFMSKGEPIVLSGVSNGALIASSGGFYGCSEQLSGSNESPMPLLSLGLAFIDSFVFGFRNSANGEGFIRVMGGPVGSVISLRTGAGAVVLGQENIQLEPYQHYTLNMDGNQEYALHASHPIMACVHAEMDSNRYYDSRLVMPTSNDIMGWGRNGDVSGPYNGTAVDWFRRTGTSGSFTVSPGSPVDLQAATGASDSDLEPNGMVRLLATGLVSAYSGADSAGLEALPLMPVSGMSTTLAQPFFIPDTGDGGNSGISLASPYEGEARIYEWNDVTKTADLKYIVPLTRGVEATTAELQKVPCAGMVSNDTTASGV
ncbi:MAG: hypothetical protein AAFP86_19850, partial [Planctomycetota bacterium]